jgi:hypothetical protein
MGETTGEHAALLMREIYTNREAALAEATMARKQAAAAGNRVGQRLEEIRGEKQRWPNSP